MDENSINKEALAAINPKEIERQQSVKGQTTTKKSAQVSNCTQQQRASTLSALAAPYYNTIMRDQTTSILQGNNEEKKKVYYDIPINFSSQSQRHKTSSSKALTWDASCLEVTA